MLKQKEIVPRSLSRLQCVCVWKPGRSYTASVPQMFGSQCLYIVSAQVNLMIEGCAELIKIEQGLEIGDPVRRYSI